MEKSKKNYVPMTISVIKVEIESAFLASSNVETEEKEFKGHTDNYETENITWDTISFD